MTECPTCKLLMESHSTHELMECCMKQVRSDKVVLDKEQIGTCPNCKHNIASHSNKELAECTLEFLKSDIHDG